MYLSSQFKTLVAIVISIILQFLNNAEFVQIIPIKKEKILLQYYTFLTNEQVI